MNAATDNPQNEPFRENGNGSILAYLIDKFESKTQLLIESLEACDDTRIKKYDAEITSIFNQILSLSLDSPEDRILLTEFLLEQLGIENSSLNDSIRSKILEIVKISQVS